jgi:hypothetical protein
MRDAGKRITGIFSTRVVVVAFLRCEHALSGRRTAGIGSTGVLIVADDRRIDTALRRIARVVRALVAVVAVDVQVLAADAGAALVNRAEIIIVTAAGTGNALAEHTVIIGGAWIAILAPAFHRSAVAAGDRVTEILCTFIAVIAVRGPGATNTLTIATHVLDRADVIVIAAGRVIQTDATTIGHAVVIGAGIPVVTGDSRIPADTLDAKIRRTFRLIVALEIVRTVRAQRDLLVYALPVQTTVINRALLAVVAVCQHTGLAQAGLTLVANRTGIAVIAGSRTDHMDAVIDFSVAAIQGAAVSIITVAVCVTAPAVGDDHVLATAFIRADIGRTFVRVIALSGNVAQSTGRFVDAAKFSVAGIDRTGLPVVTRLNRILTIAGSRAVLAGAGVTVIALRVGHACTGNLVNTAEAGDTGVTGAQVAVGTVDGRILTDTGFHVARINGTFGQIITVGIRRTTAAARYLFITARSRLHAAPVGRTRIFVIAVHVTDFALG